MQKSKEIRQGIVSASAGGQHFVYLLSDGSVKAKGSNKAGQCDIPSYQGYALEVSAGWCHTLVLTDQMQVFACGDNRRGQCDVPEGLMNIKAISAGWGHSLALTESGQVVAWGDNTFGQCDVPGNIKDIAAISAGWNHSLAMNYDGRIYAWGDNTYGQIKMPKDLKKVRMISAGARHSLALHEDGSMTNWGAEMQGQEDASMGSMKLKAVAAGAYHSLFLGENGEVSICGNPVFSECSMPKLLAKATKVYAGGNHSLVVCNDGAIVAWGSETFVRSCDLSSDGQNTAVCVGGEAVEIDFSKGMRDKNGRNFEDLIRIPDQLIEARGLNIKAYRIQKQRKAYKMLIAVLLSAFLCVAFFGGAAVVKRISDDNYFGHLYAANAYALNDEKCPFLIKRADGEMLHMNAGGYLFFEKGAPEKIYFIVKLPQKYLKEDGKHAAKELECVVKEEQLFQIINRLKESVDAQKEVMALKENDYSICIAMENIGGKTMRITKIADPLDFKKNIVHDITCTILASNDGGKNTSAQKTIKSKNITIRID